MTEVFFYHLETSTPQQALPELLEKTVQKGWRGYVHGLEDDKIEALDTHLWTYKPQVFLAHGRESEPLAARQPVLLGTSGDMVNKPDVYVSISPANLPDISGLSRCLIVFEGADEAHLGWARGLWKQMKADGHSLAYWKQNELGRWEKVQ